MDRWQEYRAGTLTPPCVIQCDQCANVFLIWVWTGSEILGPFSRTTYSEQTIVDEVANMVVEPEEEVQTETFSIICQDDTTATLEVPV